MGDHGIEKALKLAFSDVFADGIFDWFDVAVFDLHLSRALLLHQLVEGFL